MRPVTKTGQEPSDVHGYIYTHFRDELYKIIRQTPVRFNFSGQPVHWDDDVVEDMMDEVMESGLSISSLYMKSIENNLPYVQDILMIKGFPFLGISHMDTRSILNNMEIE